MEKAIFFIGLGIFCAVIGLQLGLHNCYNLADKPLCIKKEDVNHHVNKALNKLMCRIIKTVMNYQN